jgi:hypothetical protein
MPSSGGTVVEGDGFTFELPPGFVRDGEAYRREQHRVVAQVIKSSKDEERYATDHHPGAKLVTKAIAGHAVTWALKSTQAETTTAAIAQREGRIFELVCSGPPSDPPKTDVVCETILLSLRVP